MQKIDIYLGTGEDHVLVDSADGYDSIRHNVDPDSGDLLVQCKTAGVVVRTIEIPGGGWTEVWVDDELTTVAEPPQ